MPVCVGPPGEASAALPQETEQPVYTLNVQGDSEADASHGSETLLGQNPLLDQYIALMTHMRATRPEIVRGICTFRVIHGAPRLWLEGKIK